MSRLPRPVATVASLALLLALPIDLPARQANPVSALVGGTLIEGFGGPAIRNSVILIEGERIKAVGQVGTLPIPTSTGTRPTRRSSNQ